MKTIVGLLSNYREALSLVDELTACGFKSEDIDVIGTDPEGSPKESGEELCRSIEEFFGTEEDLEVRGYYSEGVRRGGVLVGVFVEDEEVDRAADIMIRHGAIDVEERARDWKQAGLAGSQSNATLICAQEQQELRTPPMARMEVRDSHDAGRGRVRVYSHSAQ